MKEQAIQYLAFDVHQATVVANQRDESGKVVLQATVPTEAQAILRLVKGAGPPVCRLPELVHPKCLASAREQL